MRRTRLRLLAAVLMAALGAGAIALWAHQRGAAETPATAARGKPTLLLLTSLPLMFGEGFDIGATGSPALEALQSHFRVVPISTSAADELKGGRLLLMAQPLAQRAQDLVALDGWVRRGGRIVLLADPLLEWPSERPLGDPLRPVPMFADTGLLGHWGVRLDAPDARGPRMGRIGAAEVMTASPGALVGTAKNCSVLAGRLVARCSVGSGRATIIADADFLNVAGQGAIDGPTSQNLQALVSELAVLGR
jgi:hypothetical protein